MGKSEYTEEQVREAFKLGQQWVKDINEGLDPVSLNEWLSGQDSHSPTEPITEFDTLQEGDFFIGTEEEYRRVLEIAKHDFPGTFDYGMMFFGSAEYLGDSGLKSRIPSFIEYAGITQLTAPEFIRRAENTFKKK